MAASNSASTTRNASQGERDCICFQRSAYKSDAQRAALHSAHHYTAPSASLHTALHCQRCTVRNIVHHAPSQEEAERSEKRGLGGGSPRQPNQALRRRSRAQRQAGVLRSLQRSTASNDLKRFIRFARLHLLSAQRIYSAHRYIARSATECAVLHSAQRCTALHSA